MRFPLFLIFMAFLLFTIGSFGQEKVVKIHFDDSNTTDLLDEFKSIPAENAELSANKMREKLINKGFLEASVDSLTENEDSLFFYFHAGPIYTFDYLNIELNDQDLFSIWQKGHKKIMSPTIFNARMERSLSWMENHGFPFAEIHLKELNFDGLNLNARIEVDRKQLILFDSLIIKSETKFNSKFLSRYLKLNKGDVYREAAIKGINQKISALAYAQNSKTPQVAFKENEAWVYIYPKKKKANRFNGIVGFIRDVGDEKARITGEVNLLLQNALNYGEKIELNWQQLRPKSQDLHINLNYPYIFYSDFGTALDFELLKRDTAYLELQNALGIQYYLEGENYLGVYFKNRQSDVLKEIVSVSDQFSNTSSVSYGLKFRWQKLDNPFNASKGFLIEIAGDAGTKKIKKINSLGEAFYQDLKLESDQYNTEITCAYYIPLGKRTVIKNQIKSAFIINDQILENEMLRIGGINSLRGFNEEAITNTGNIIITEELRLLTDEFSNFYVFGDFGWYEKKGLSTTVTDTPIGFGVGTSIESAVGIFTLNYALGKQFDNPIEFQNGKIHFGFVSIF